MTVAFLPVSSSGRTQPGQAFAFRAIALDAIADFVVQGMPEVIIPEAGVIKRITLEIKALM
jgi:hypothetical protein